MADEPESPIGRGNRDRKRELEKRGGINCSRCPYHKQDNTKRSGRPRPDTHKSKRRGR